MKLTKFRKKTIEDLEKELQNEREELDSIYFDVRVGKEKDYAQIKLKRKNLARILTVLKERREERKSKTKKESVKKTKKQEESVKKTKSGETKSKATKKPLDQIKNK